jgi:methionyl-tRNA formyltransferase
MPSPPTPPLRLAFLGSDAIALPLLDGLAAAAAAGTGPVQLVGLYTQPDRPRGRGQKLQPGPIKQWALAHRLPVVQPARLGPEDVVRLRQDWRADVALVFAYGLLLKQDMLDAPRLGTFNLHTSLLPRFRGASPVATAIASGARETGLSFMRLVLALDAGPVADVERLPIGPHDTGETVTARLAAAAVPLARRCLAALRSGTLAFVEQDATQATYCRRLTKEDGALDFTQPANQLAARINGLFPWPTCTVEILGTPVKLGLADAIEGMAAPGTVAGADAAGLLVGTGAGLLRLRRLQRPGARMLGAPEFLRGFPIAPGTVLPSQPMPLLESPTPWPPPPRRPG